MLYYVTGTSASGKTTLVKCLRRNGFSAYDGDDYCAYHNRRGLKTSWPSDPELRTPEWFQENPWLMDTDFVRQCQRLHQKDPAFICGVAHNEEDYWHYFEKTFYLDLDWATLEERLLTRTTNIYGKTDYELEVIYQFHRNAKERYLSLGAEIIDGTNSPQRISEQILESI
jgi:gluconate kinase